MAYNTTTWTTDSNTKADANTTESQFYVYKSVYAQTDKSSGTTAYFVDFGYSGSAAAENPNPSVGGNRYLWATSGSLVKGYFVTEDWNPNDSSNTMEFKVYKLTPNTDSTSGDRIASSSNYTLLETVTISNANLQAEGRGIVVDFTESTCSFSKGDIMAISFQNTVNVTDNAADSTDIAFVLKEDWNDIISSNV